MTLADVINRLEEASLIMFTDDRDGKPPITAWLDDESIDPETPIGGTALTTRDKEIISVLVREHIEYIEHNTSPDDFDGQERTKDEELTELRSLVGKVEQ